MYGDMPLAFVDISAFFDILKDNETFKVQVTKKLLQVVRDVQRGPLVKLEKGVSFFLVQERTFPLALFVE